MARTCGANCISPSSLMEVSCPIKSRPNIISIQISVSTYNLVICVCECNCTLNAFMFQYAISALFPLLQHRLTRPLSLGEQLPSKGMTLLTGNSHLQMAEAIGKTLGVTLGQCISHKNTAKETLVKIEDNLRCLLILPSFFPPCAFLGSFITHRLCNTTTIELL